MANKSTVYFANETHLGTEDSPPIETYQSSKDFERATKKEGGVFWGGKAANADSRFSDWDSLNSVDTDEETAKRVKHATKLLVAFTTYVETVATLNQVRDAVKQHPDNEDLVKREAALQKTLAAAEKDSNWSILESLPGFLSGLKDGADTLKSIREILGYKNSK